MSKTASECYPFCQKRYNSLLLCRHWRWSQSWTVTGTASSRRRTWWRFYREPGISGRGHCKCRCFFWQHRTRQQLGQPRHAAHLMEEYVFIIVPVRQFTCYILTYGALRSAARCQRCPAAQVPWSVPGGTHAPTRPRNFIILFCCFLFFGGMCCESQEGGCVFAYVDSGLRDCGLLCCAGMGSVCDSAAFECT